MGIFDDGLPHQFIAREHFRHLDPREEEIARLTQALHVMQRDLLIANDRHRASQREAEELRVKLKRAEREKDKGERMTLAQRMTSAFTRLVERDLGRPPGSRHVQVATASWDGDGLVRVEVVFSERPFGKNERYLP